MLVLLVGVTLGHVGGAADAHGSVALSPTVEHQHHEAGHPDCSEEHCSRAAHGTAGCCGLGHRAATLSTGPGDLSRPPKGATVFSLPRQSIHYGLRFGIERPPKLA